MKTFRRSLLPALACVAALLSTRAARSQNLVTTISGLPGAGGMYAAVNSATNMVYVTNAGYVTVINGQTNAVVTSIPVGINPTQVAVNPVTNMIYVANTGFSDGIGGNISVISGATNTVVATIGSTNQLECPFSIAVNSVTNKVYVGDTLDFQLTVIDGATNAYSSLTLTSALNTIAVNPVTNRSTSGARTASTSSRARWAARRPASTRRSLTRAAAAASR